MQTFVAQATVEALQEGGWVGLRDAMRWLSTFISCDQRRIEVKVNPLLLLIATKKRPVRRQSFY